MAITGVLRRGQQELGTTEVSLQNQPKALSAFNKVSIALSKGIGTGERCYKKDKRNGYLSAVFPFIHSGVGLTDSENQPKGSLPGSSVQPRGSLVSSHLLIIAIAWSLPFLTTCPSRRYPSFHLRFQFKIIQRQNFRTGPSDNIFILLPNSGILGKSPLKSPLLASKAQSPHGKEGLRRQSSQQLKLFTLPPSSSKTPTCIHTHLRKPALTIPLTHEGEKKCHP